MTDFYEVQYWVNLGEFPKRYENHCFIQIINVAFIIFLKKTWGSFFLKEIT